MWQGSCSTSLCLALSPVRTEQYYLTCILRWRQDGWHHCELGNDSLQALCLPLRQPRRSRFSIIQGQLSQHGWKISPKPSLSWFRSTFKISDFQISGCWLWDGRTSTSVCFTEWETGVPLWAHDRLYGTCLHEILLQTNPATANKRQTDKALPGTKCLQHCWALCGISDLRLNPHSNPKR